MTTSDESLKAMSQCAEATSKFRSIELSSISVGISYFVILILSLGAKRLQQITLSNMTISSLTNFCSSEYLFKTLVLGDNFKFVFREVYQQLIGRKVLTDDEARTAIDALMNECMN